MAKPEISNKILVILGATACGKTQVGVKLAAKLNGEIVSADSRQVYKGMDVGTGKDLGNYKLRIKNYELKRTQEHKNTRTIIKIPYHLIDVVGPTAEFNVAKYQKLAYKAIEDILRRGKTPIIVGGTGLYIDAVVEGYIFTRTREQKNTRTRRELGRLTLKQLLARLKKIDPKTYKIIDRKNRRRVERALEIYYQTGRPKSEVAKKEKPPYQFLKIGIVYPREVTAKRIEKRLKERLEKEGMVAEARRLHRQGLSWKKMNDFGLEYRWLARYLQKQVSYDEMVSGLARDIKNYAKRQMTWFKRDKEVRWINEYREIEGEVREWLKG